MPVSRATTHTAMTLSNGAETAKRLPLFFKYTDRVFGAGFMATVEVRGRVLCQYSEEDGAWWMLGVAPGGIAASGANPDDAHADFRRAYREVLFDIAEEATEEDFRAQVNDFVSGRNADVEAEWRRAVEDVRAGRLNVPEMERLTADLPEKVEIIVRRTLQPCENKTQRKIDEAEPRHLVAA